MDAKPQLYLTMTLTESVKSHLFTLTTAAEMYQKLKDLYQKDTEQQKCMLLQQFYTYNWQSSKSAMDNIGAIQNITHQLSQMQHLIPEIGVKAKIISILPPSMQYFTSAWESVQPANKTIANLCSRLQLEEMKIVNHPENPGQAFFSSAASRNQNYKARTNDLREKLTCYTYEKKEHKKRDCKKQFRCNICKSKYNNHDEEECHFKPSFCRKCRKEHAPQKCDSDRREYSKHDDHKRRYQSDRDRSDQHREKRSDYDNP